MTQPNDTTPVFITTENIDNAAGTTALLLTSAAQQAVLPRRLEEGVYGVLNPEGGVDITETPGYTQRREQAWLRARSDRPEFVHRSPVLLDVDSFVDYLARNTMGSTVEVNSAKSACGNSFPSMCDHSAHSRDTFSSRVAVCCRSPS